MTEETDRLIRESLTEFADRLGGWTGRREHEAKSLYAFGHLVPRCRPGAFLHSPDQIALDTPVPQIAPTEQQALSGGTARTKRAVAKDLVIWPVPRATCWRDGRPVASPSVVMEWKLNQTGVSAYDVAWLRAFSTGRDRFVGYAVAVDLRGRRPLLTCTRVLGGAAEGWLTVE